MIKRALISVFNKSGVVEFAQGLAALGVEIISTGGTYKKLKESGVPVVEVAEYAGFPEMLDGRVKTLQPQIHAGILAIRDSAEHMAQLAQHGIGTIDLVAVNLYPFRETVAKPDVTLADAIENIDIGGPTMVRAAAKNHAGVAIVVDPARYPQLLAELQERGEVSPGGGGLQAHRCLRCRGQRLAGHHRPGPARRHRSSGALPALGEPPAHQGAGPALR